MSCEEAWNRVRELLDEAAKAHEAYEALVKALPLLPETSQVIVEARERYSQADEMLLSEMQEAMRAQH